MGMDVQVKLFYFFADLILPLAAGYLCRRQNWFGNDFFAKMITFNIILLAPVLAILSFWTLKLDSQLIWLPVLGIMISIVPGLAAYGLSKHKFTHPWEQGSYILAASLSNQGTLGGLGAFFLYGEAGYAYTQLIAMFFNAMVFAFFFPMARYYYLKGQGKSNFKLNIFSIIFSWNQLPVVGLIIGVALPFFGVARPAVLGLVFDPLVHLSAWTMLMPVGQSIDFGEMRKYFRGILDLIPIKFLLTPAVIYGMGTLLVHDRQMLHTLLVIASTPPAINSVITAKIHSLNVDVAMAAFILLTAMYIILVYPVLFVTLAM